MLKQRIALAVTAVCVAAVHPAGAQTRGKSAGSAVPKRFAIGMRQGEGPPYTVEATSDGWVSVTFEAADPNPDLTAPPQHLMVEPSDVRAFTSAARQLADDPRVPFSLLPRTTLKLGRGGRRIEFATTSARPTMASPASYSRFFKCNVPSDFPITGQAELFDLFALLDSAANVASRARREPKAPTLHRAYFASEVSCAPRALKPHGIVTSQRVRPGLVVPLQFIVDTSGNVEPASLQFMASTPATAMDAARGIVPTWHYTPGEVDGTPVRSFVQTTLSFGPTFSSNLAAFPISSRPVDVLAHPDTNGWVRVDVTVPGGVGATMKDWMTPDLVEKFIARTHIVVDSAAFLLNNRQPLDSARTWIRETYLGYAGGGILRAAYLLDPQEARVITQWVYCNKANLGTPSLSEPLLETFQRAAREARAMRSPADDFRVQTFDSADVACPTSLPWSHSTRAGFNKAWMSPVGSLPGSSEPQSTYIDVLFSVVVDANGFVDLSTLETLPQVDQAIVKNLRNSLRALRFDPAKRGGLSVRQRVIQALRFERPVVCARADDGPTCPRRYSEQ